jgi:hypothetical protein
MILARDRLAQFIEGEGHRVEVTISESDENDATLLFRTRGCIITLAVHEDEPPRFTIAAAYEIPSWARECAQNAMALHDAASAVKGVRFTLAENGKNFATVLESSAESVETFQRGFWPNVARVREAGVSALEHILDSSESRAAADKFIKSLQLRGRG